MTVFITGQWAFVMDALVSAEELPAGRIALSFILTGADAEAARRWLADHTRPPDTNGQPTQDPGQ
jgi:hypothetical protein